jgi:tRNA nucleotidyltransferase (CCA-adding enzyme)
MHPDTERLARAATEEGALATVSGARIRDELIDLLAEPQAPAGVARMAELGIDRALHPALSADPALVASTSLGAVAIGADRALAALAALSSEAPQELEAWLADLHLTAIERDRVTRAAAAGPQLARELHSREHTPSALARVLGGEPPEALALALALGAPPEPILRWADELRDVRLEISGDDLIAAGVAEGPALGRALAQTLARKLDGLVAGREQELETALRLAKEGS